MSVLFLANVFKDFQIYPQEAYTSGTPIKEFQQLFPHNYFSTDIEILINEQQFPSSRRGADLPWWGEQFFHHSNGPRVMLIAQDSNALDAGSVVMYSPLYNEIPVTSEKNYNEFISKLSSKELFKYHNWKKAFQQLIDWKLNLNHLYFTDAKKVYKTHFEGHKDKFDQGKCASLLEKEIEVTSPDYIITLGSQAYDLLSKTSILSEKRIYSEAVEYGEVIPLTQGKLIVSPFITGQCHTSHDFKNRLKIASDLIIKEISNKYE